MLLILDNFEQVVAAGSELSMLLTTAPGIKLLVTSRELLRISGEQNYPTFTLANFPPHKTHMRLKSYLKMRPPVYLWSEHAQSTRILPEP